ncbi:MAG: hypothetical protein E4G93_06060 [Dehalococcoidia bacterium]|nr:MAG: hypothetical protein E4G93_06060 [Dehalococcoidia bacterium]
MERSTDMDDAISNAIEGIYSAFADAPKPRQLMGCQHCIGILDDSALTSLELRAIPSRILAPYVWKAMLTVGTEEDFFYFLPRILELVATDPDFSVDTEVVGSRVGSTDVSAWPTHRSHALFVYLGVVVRRAVAAEDFAGFDAWICAIALMNVEVMSFLKEIEPSRNGILEYFTHNAKTLPTGRLANAFWETPGPGHDNVVAWFHSESIAGLLREEYGYVFPDTKQAE